MSRPFACAAAVAVLMLAGCGARGGPGPCAGARCQRPAASSGARRWPTAPRGRPDTPRRTAARAPVNPRRSDLHHRRGPAGDGPSRTLWDLLGGPAGGPLPGFWPLTGGHDGQQRRRRQRARPRAERHRMGRAVLLAVVGDRQRAPHRPRRRYLRRSVTTCSGQPRPHRRPFRVAPGSPGHDGRRGAARAGGGCERGQVANPMWRW